MHAHAAVSDEAIPETLTLDQAFRAAFFLADQYLALERVPDEGAVALPPVPAVRPGPLGRLESGSPSGGGGHWNRSSRRESPPR